MQKTFFVTGVNTEIGKTVASAILAEALEADYWKPIQSGHLHHTDSDRIHAYISNKKTVVHPEQFKLSESISPFAAAKIDNTKIRIKDLKLPKTKNHLIIEGTGGLLVPINKKECMIDFIEQFNIPVILVSMNYTGSVNHTLLSIEALKSRKIPIAGIIFNGKSTPKSEEVILRMTEIPLLGNIQRLNDITKVSIKAEAKKFARFNQLGKSKSKDKKSFSFFSF